MSPTCVGVSWVHGVALLAFLALLSENIHAQNSEVCTLCQDGSQHTIPNGKITFRGESWSCSNLSQILWLLGVPSNTEECTLLQFGSFTDCGCPTFQDDDYCAMCPGGVTDIPNPNTTIPGYGDLTCGHIVFAHREDEDVPIPCNELRRYTKLCQCPESCTFCRYSDETPQYPDRIIPYLTQGDNHVTCAEHAAEASSLLLGESCDEFRKTPVPVNVEGYCGCPRSSPPNLCSLCPDGGPLRDPNMVIPNVGGLTCAELQEYLSFVSDLDSCTAISDRSQACCGYFDPCPICDKGHAYGLGSGKVYEPYGLGCDQIGQAIHFGFPLTCPVAQERFPFFCRCEGATPQCTICPLNLVPPEPSRFIPMLNMTCGEANDFVSLRTALECKDTLANFKVDVAGFCGCSEDTSLFGRCAFCPEGQELRFPQEARDGNIFGSTVVSSGGSTIADHCRKMEAIAPYITEVSLCRAVQESSVPVCCRRSSTEAPTLSPQPTFQPSIFPTGTFQPTTTNVSYPDNITTLFPVNFTNETLAPATPPTSIPSTADVDEDSSSLPYRSMNAVVLQVAVSVTIYFL